ncbi:MAG: hypothetical protein JEZ09_11310 [Salinivirgaceae bacterium]|nr:hypothetical protein [Salinivirgaceae bacterium]
MSKNLNKIIAICVFLIINLAATDAQQIKKTQILILGTLHLNKTKNIESKQLNRVLDSLSKFNFDVIGIERMPVELLKDIQHRDNPEWKELFSYFEEDIKTGEFYQSRCKINYRNAQLIIDSLLNKEILSEFDRINLVKASLCSYDPWTALLHYHFIQNKVIIDTNIVALMNSYNKSLNEINTIGVNLSIRQNINRLHPIDNMQDETILLHDFPEFLNDYEESQERIAGLLNNPFYQKMDSIQFNCIQKGDLYEMYKFLNSYEYMNEDKKGQWDIWFKTNFISKSDRSRYSLWEMRNLQITANIMRLVAEYPEKKILIIIGASHKSFIERHLKQMSDVKLIEF